MYDKGNYKMKLTPIEKWILDKTGIEKRDIKEIEKYQLNKIKEVIEYAKKYSNFYKELLGDNYESSINSLEDFEKIPFTLPHHIRNSPLSFLCVSQKDIARVVTLRSSGTSGQEKRIFFTEKDLQLTIDFFKHGMSCLVDKGDKVLVLLPGESYGSIGDLLKKALKEVDIECYVQGVLTNTKDTANLIQDKEISCIVGIPIQLLHLSRVESTIFKNNIKRVLLSTDYVPETLIKEITDKFGCQVFTHYGMTEMGYGGGVECEALSGYHMRDADLYFEIIDPITGKRVEDGQQGEVVFTTLTREGMPLIRYRTGDIASFSSKSCSCGTFFKTMNRVSGRLENSIILDDNIIIHMRDLDEVIFSFPEVINYKVYIKDKNVLLIKLFTLNEDQFYSIYKKIIDGIRNISSLKEGMNKGIMKIILEHSKENIQITNSMVKRKICLVTNGQ
ncbi:Phenylacetate-coenzyme A ligase PaaK, adenylate-forming domain family [Clostridium magnum DSM 2767]|nr:Phenylacetate-coenzyme A ligase PaaK, adenylate-forming domain family [Clostridium magnum DSM 2767]